MVKTAPPVRPTAINLSDPATYNTRALANFNYVQAVATWAAGLDAADYLDVVGTFGGAKNPVMERGTNSNGNYFRFANRLQICFILSLAHPGTGTAEGSEFRSIDGNWIFPAGFTTQPLVIGSANYRTRKLTTSLPSIFGVDFRTYSSVPDNTARPVSIGAIGFF